MSGTTRCGRALLFVGLALLASAGTAAGQEKPGGTVVYAEGREFSLVRAGVVTRFFPEDGTYAGYAVREGDLLQTGGSTFVEVQLLPKGTMLKIAENTSFQFQKIGDATSETNLNVLYGRIRTKVAKLSAAESFLVRSRSTVAGVRGTDFGFDSLLAPGSASAATVRVYAFEGEVSVSPVAVDSKAAAPTLSVKAGELLAVDLSTSIPLVERRAVDDEIRSYWRTNDFKGQPPIPAPAGARLGAAEANPPVPAAPAQIPALPQTVPPPPASPARGAQSSAAPSPVPAAEAPKGGSETQIRYEPPNYEPYRKALAKRQNTIVGAFVIGLGALAIQAAGATLIVAGDADTGAPLMLTSGVLVGASLITLGTSFFAQTPQ